VEAWEGFWDVERLDESRTLIAGVGSVVTMSGVRPLVVIAGYPGTQPVVPGDVGEELNLERFERQLVPLSEFHENVAGNVEGALR
jgi:hypothetical protein